MTDGLRQLEATGDVARHLARLDWSSSPLGAPDAWPTSLWTVLRLMLGSRFAMWMGYGPDLTFFCNDAYRTETLGLKFPWALGRPAREVWSEIWPEIEPRIAHVLRTGEPTYDAQLLLLVERNGYREESYHSFSYSAVPGELPGERAGLFCVVVEETARVLSGRRLDLLRDLSATLAGATSPDDVLRGAAKSLRTSARDFPFALVYGIDARGIRCVETPGFEHTVATPPVPVAELRELRAARVVSLAADVAWPPGPWTTPPAEAMLLPILDPAHGEPVGALVLGLSPHRRPDEALRSLLDLFAGQVAASFATARAHVEQVARAEALAELDRAKTTFFSNVSHELRTPLTLMLGPTEDALASPEGVLRGADLETVHRNAIRLRKLVNALLDFARIEAGRMQASFAPTDLATLTADLASAFRSAVGRAGLDFVVDCPPLTEPVFVDRDLWEKVVHNLLSNALKFTFTGAITVRLRDLEDAVELVVADTGVGIRAEDLPRLFERFHRIPGGRARTHEGTGIGLALVRDLVRLHGGTITAASEVGRGTTFTLRLRRGHNHLPAEQVAATAAPAPSGSALGGALVNDALSWVPGPEADRPSTAPERAGAPRVLVADDNRDMRDYVARILGAAFDVVTVPDGAAALAAVRDRAPDLVLADVMMPGLDGFALVRELRAAPATAGLPIVLLSARAGEEATADGLRTGADDYLVKPFSAAALLVRVEAQLAATRLRSTLRAKAEEERARLQALVEESPAAIAVFRGDDLVIELANPTMRAAWGWSTELLGRPLLEAVPTLRGQGLDTQLRAALATGTASRNQTQRFLLAAGPKPVERWVDVVYAPLRGAAPNAEAAVVLHAFDVTDKVLAFRRLEQLRSEAEGANRVKDEFLATMSHELRTPLNAILGWASLLRDRVGGDTEALQRGLATIERNARAQARLIEDVLDVSRIISGKLRLELAPVDLVVVALAAVDVVKPAARAKGVELVLELPAATSHEVSADADRLQQVVWNLLSNAIKFTPAGGTVHLAVHAREGHVELVVRDSGTGIPPEHLPHVFERFRQVDSSTTRKFGGLGLGLAIVRHLTELHGGAVNAASDGLGRGATFTVRLPRRDGAGATHGADGAASEGRRSEVAARLADVRVLVVEDDEDSRLFVESALELAGADVVSTADVDAALAAVATRPIDVVVSDIGMPDVDGFELLRRIRAMAPASLPAIALTAYAGETDALRIAAAGFQRHLVKPADVRAIVEAVAELVTPRGAPS